MKRSQAVMEAGSNKKAKISSEDSEGWTKVEKRKQKKARKEEIKADATQPRFMYANSEIVKRNHAIGVDDVRDLVLYLTADGATPNWLRVNDATLIQKVVTLLIPGLTPELLGLPPLPTAATSNPNVPISIPLPSPESASALPFIASTFSHACPTRAPGDQNRMHSILAAFFQGPITAAELKKRVTTQTTSQRTSEKDPAQYLLTLEQMVENEYPIPSYMADVFEKSDDWIETPEEPKTELLDGLSKRKRTVYSIDCEMCLTESGKELTRVCLIDCDSGIVVYDQLVKPSKPILDYLTRWSGITAAQLAPVTTTLAQVQAHILRLLSPPAPNPFSTSNASPAPFLTPILIGHSLESDLKALKLCHSMCIDTALLYHHPRGRPLKPGLAWLIKKWCGREIQTRGEGGHDPEEDARACVELLQKKLANGPGYGEFKTDYESIFERMVRTARHGEKHRAAVVDIGNPAVMHGSKATTAIGCKDDEEVLKGVLEAVPSHHFVFGRFMALANVLGWASPKQEPGTLLTTELTPPPEPEVMQPLLATLDQQLKTLYASLPPRTALVIFTGHSDPRKMTLLNARKTAFESAIRSGTLPEDLAAELRWSASDGRDLEEAVALAKRGLLFLGVVS
ncbi:ribonuclease H [Roridomyces roridus]|uniref:Ribonuclease H n=1 Tax=Roridomyces roridus TaxID=1738132 RepID=A0AAD7C769_9AGAR|nr:ribonuclease H [Roridomyces roridus]KAJ7640971.1 ribonuclease H [Roridomyces roridus]